MKTFNEYCYFCRDARSSEVSVSRDKVTSLSPALTSSRSDNCTITVPYRYYPTTNKCHMHIPRHLLFSTVTLTAWPVHLVTDATAAERLPLMNGVLTCVICCLLCSLSASLERTWQYKLFYWLALELHYYLSL